MISERETTVGIGLNVIPSYTISFYRLKILIKFKTSKINTNKFYEKTHVLVFCTCCATIKLF
jgi:tRNA G26 N,N-dimethylase Trm1